MYMQGLANFIDDFLGGLILIGYALVIGSIIWSTVILRCWSKVSEKPNIVVRAVSIMQLGASSLALMQFTKLLIKAMVLMGVLGELPIADYVNTVQFKAGLVRLVLAGGIAWLLD